jgi:hypothetical protein
MARSWHSAKFSAYTAISGQEGGIALECSLNQILETTTLPGYKGLVRGVPVVGVKRHGAEE